MGVRIRTAVSVVLARVRRVEGAVGVQEVREPTVTVVTKVMGTKALPMQRKFTVAVAQTRIQKAPAGLVVVEGRELPQAVGVVGTVAGEEAMTMVVAAAEGPTWAG